MKPTQKLRIVINSISIFTTAKQIRNGLGDFYTVNAAAQKALLVLEDMREHDRFPPTGLGGTWEGMQVQLSMI
jgi:hypothetical protein